jgi:Tol biopolymer transport system component
MDYILLLLCPAPFFFRLPAMQIKTFAYFCLLLAFFFLPTVQDGNTLYAQFGKNKVQYQSFNWKFIRTKHFDVYFAENGEYLARYAGIQAERSLLSIQQRLNYTVTKRIPLIIYNSHNEFQQTNVVGDFLQEGIGGVTELFKNRVVLPFEGRYEQFRHVIHHELVHAVLNDMFYGGSVQTAIANNIRVDLPLWMNEGLAEYEGNGGYDTPTDMFMRDIALSEYLKGFDNLRGYYAYRGGQAFFWYIADKYGERKIGELLGRLRVLGTLDAAFKSSFGKSIEDFSEEWVREMKKKYLPDIDRYESLDEFAVRITNHEKENSFYNSSPALSPDGDQLAFISNRGDFFGVYIMDLRSPEKEVRELISSGRALDFEELNILTPGISWSPDGKKLAVSAKSGGEDALYIVDVKSGDYVRKRFGLRTVHSAIWSPDGASIAFVGSVGEQPDIWIYDVATGAIKRVTDDLFTDQNPVWSPDSKILYFVSDRGNYLNGEFKAPGFRIWELDHKNQDIYALEMETGKMKRITAEPGSQKTSLAISPDGSRLLYVSDKNGIGNLYQMDLQTGSIKAKTNSISGITQLALSKDGARLFFTSQNKGGYDIFELRFPLERREYADTLPLTKFMAAKLQKNQPSQAGAMPPAAPPATARMPLQGFGNGSVELEFSRQQLIQPNPDAIRSRDIPTQPITTTAGMAAMESVIADTIATPVQDYKISFSTDLILTNAGYNTFWGYQGVTQMLFSDVLGDHQIYFQANLFLDLRNSNFLLAYSYMPEIVDYQITANHYVGFGYSYRDNSPFAYLYRFRNFGVGINASYPFDRFRRLEFGINWMNLSKENTEVPTEAVQSRNLFVPEIRYVFDNTLDGWYGPATGTRYFAGIQATPRLGNNGLGFAIANADIRHYFSVMDNYITFALRGAGGMGFSTSPDQKFFFLGGLDNWINRRFSNGVLPFQNPEDFAFLNYALPLRGWDVNERNGTKYALFNAEMRFPLFRALMAGPVPLMIQALQGAFFMDIGTAWRDSLNTKLAVSGDPYRYFRPDAGDLMMSMGIGIRSFLLGLPLRVDIAWRNEYSGWSEPRWLFSLGGDF